LSVTGPRSGLTARTSWLDFELSDMFAVFDVVGGEAEGGRGSLIR
jgi:hypothetical protein